MSGSDAGSVSARLLAGIRDVLIINTPHLREFRDDEQLKGFLPDDMLVQLTKCEVEAALYLKGKRAQGDLFGGDA